MNPSEGGRAAADSHVRACARRGSCWAFGHSIQVMHTMSGRLCAVAIVGLVALLPLLASSAAPGDEFAQTVRSLYSFQPHTLTDDQITDKSKELDTFWERVKSDPARYLSLLRHALADGTSPSFFSYDGSKLLLSLSPEREDQQLALTAIPRCDLRDVQHKDYLFTVFRLAAQGLDTSEAAFKILEDPKFQVIVPEHALTLGQDFSLIYMLLPTSEDFHVGRAIDRLSVERDVTAQKSLLRLLWYTVTDAGDQAITRVAGSERHAAEVREFARDLSSTTETLRQAAKPPKTLAKAVADLVPKGADFAQIKQIRRSRLSRVSDEALHELDDLTWLLRIKRQAELDRQRK